MRTTFPVAAPAEAWAALADPVRLAAALPGCRSVTRDVEGDGTLHVVTDVAVASVRGVWAGTVVPVDADTVRVTGSGEPGSMDVVVRADPARTTLTVEGMVDGPLGAVGSAVLGAAVRRTAEAVLTGVGQTEAEAIADRDGPPLPQPRGPLEAEAIADRRGSLLPRPRRAEVVAAAGVVLAIVVRGRRRVRRTQRRPG